MRTQRIYLARFLTLALLVGLAISKVQISGSNWPSDQSDFGGQGVKGEASSPRTLSTGLSCSDKNPFRKYFQDTWKVGSPSNSITTSGYCGEEWRTYGSCCEIAKAIDGVKSDASEINKAKELFIKQFNEFIPVAVQFLESIQRLALVSKSGMSSKEKDIVKGAKAFMEVENVPRLISRFRMMNSLTERSIYKQQMDQCWNYNNQLRSSAVCSYCSSRGDVFFNDMEDKGVAHSMYCDNIVNNCFEAHKKTIYIIKAWKKLISHDDWKKSDVEINLGDMTKNFIDQYSKFNEDSIADDINDDFINAETVKKLTSDERARFCQEFVKLAYKPFIVEFYDNIERSKSWKMTQSKEAKKLLSSRRRVLAQESSNHHTPRNLNSDYNEQMFVSDFDFYDDDQLEEMFITSSGYRGRPMNLSCAFP